MSIRTSCPQCQAKFELDENLAGKTVRCQQCQGTFQVPELEESSPADSGTLNPVPAIGPAPTKKIAAGEPPSDVGDDPSSRKNADTSSVEFPPRSAGSSTTRTRRPPVASAGKTGLGAIITVIVIALFTCVLLGGAGGTAVFYLVIKPGPPRQPRPPRPDEADLPPPKEIFEHDDEGKKDLDGPKKAWDWKKDGKGWKKPKKDDKFDFRKDGDLKKDDFDGPKDDKIGRRDVLLPLGNCLNSSSHDIDDRRLLRELLPFPPGEGWGEGALAMAGPLLILHAPPHPRPLSRRERGENATSACAFPCRDRIG